MKRMEELIHLNKKIHFEGKVSEVWRFWLCRFYFEGSYLTVVTFLFLFFFLISLSDPADLPADLSVSLAGETRRASGSGHPDDEYFRIQAQAAHQARVSPLVQRLPAAVQEEGVSDAKFLHTCL